MKVIKLKEINNAIQYLIENYEILPVQTVIFSEIQSKSLIDFQSSQNDLLVSYLYKDIMSKEDIWKYIVLAACSIVGLLDRNKIKATIKWPNDIYVKNQKIASIFIKNIEEKKGVIVTIGINVNENHGSICMKDITHRTYQLNILLTGLTTFLNIYDNLYHTNQFHKALEYANDISYLKNRKVSFSEYKNVIFEKLTRNGMLVFKDEKSFVYQKHILEIKGIKEC
ncbi:MAG: hypothetical protein ACI4SR_10875 [Faecalibacillus sp.]